MRQDWRRIMTSQQIENYINARFHKLNPFVCHRRKPTTFRRWVVDELSSDEILLLLDIDRHPEIFAFEYHNGCYRMWDYSGKEYYFCKREWK